MVLLGVVLVLLALAAGAVLLVGTAQLTDTVDIGILGGTLSLPPLVLLLAGMVLMTLFWFGWAALRHGMKRNKRRRVEATEAARQAEARRKEAEEQRLAEERRLREEIAARDAALAEERRLREEAAAGPAVTGSHPPPPPGSYPSGVPGAGPVPPGQAPPPPQGGYRP